MQIVVQTVLHVGLRFGNAALVDETLSSLLGTPARSVDRHIRDDQRLWARDEGAQKSIERNASVHVRRITQSVCCAVDCVPRSTSHRSNEQYYPWRTAISDRATQIPRTPVTATCASPKATPILRDESGSRVRRALQTTGN